MSYKPSLIVRNVTFARRMGECLYVVASVALGPARMMNRTVELYLQPEDVERILAALNASDETADSDR